MQPTSALLYVSPDRVLYRGWLGRPRERRLAASAWYLPIAGELTVLGARGEAQRGSFAVKVPAGMPHQVEATCGQVVCFLAEADFGDVPAHDESLSVRHLSSAERSVLTSLDVRRLQAWKEERRNIDLELDQLVSGRTWARRELDDRITDVVRRVRREPAQAWQAKDLATHCHLSPSRFMHLFKAELGMGWRDFRAWTRARALLVRVHTDDNLTQVALSLGYPDGTHFSHAIRQITGLTPSDIVVGSRNLSIWNDSGVSPA